MGTLITVAVILSMIAVGVLLIHLLNTQHNERIAAFRYGLLPIRRSRSSEPMRQSGGLVRPPVGGARRGGPRALSRILSGLRRRA